MHVLVLPALVAGTLLSPAVEPTAAEPDEPVSEPESELPATPTREEVDALRDENAELRERLDRIEAKLDEPAPEPPAPAPTPEPALQPSILVEVDHRTYPSEIEGQTGFSVARFRPGLYLSPVRWFRAQGTVEFAGEYPIILDAWARLRATDWMEFTVGYSKPPMFASFTYEPVQVMPFPDRSPVVSTFFIRRDAGVDVHFSPKRVPIEAWARVGNGTGSPLGNDNAIPAGYGALDLVLGRAWVGASLQQRRTFGLRLGGSALIESTRDHDGLTGRTPLGFVYYRPVVVSGLRSVAEGHTVFYAGPVRVTAEGAFAWESRSQDDDGNADTPRIDQPAVQSYGATAEVAWVILGQRREVGTAPFGVRRDDGRWRGGALEIAARYDGLWLDHGANDVQSGGSQGGGLSVKWWPTAFLSTTLAGYATGYAEAPLEDPDRTFSWGIIARAGFYWGLQGLPRPAGLPNARLR